MSHRIPFNAPAILGDELRYIAEAVEQGHLSGDGEFTRRCAHLLEEAIGARRALLTPSCTHALEICALLLDLQPGDEVIVPSFAFVTTAGAFSLHGGRPVFADIRADTLNLDEGRLRELVGPRTRAIVALHYGGVGCEMDEIVQVAQEAGVPLIEDNAHGLFGRYRGRALGSFGALATLSFHETKNFTCGEGGALLLNEERWIERAEILREKGTDRSRFFRGQVDRYSWIDRGSSYVLSDVLAAFLLAQLEARERVQAARARLWHRYRDELALWAEPRAIRLPTVPEHCESPHHVFYLLMPDAESRTTLIDRLRARGILAVFHYVPLHTSTMGRSFGGRPGDCPVTEDLSERLVRLPLYFGLDEDAQAEVIAAVREFQAD